MLSAAMAAMLPAPALANSDGVGTNGAISEPVPAIAERMQAFSDNWRFHRGDIPGAEAPEFDASAWRILDVPHDWSIEDISPASGPHTDAIWSNGASVAGPGPFDLYASQGQVATGWTVGGVGWYRKSFPGPDVPPGGKAELRFEGVYMNVDVWLNGAHLGNHPYGYTEFSFDLTPHLREGQNTIAVRVNNAGRNSRWYSGSGIYRKVWLTVHGDLRIPEYGVCVTSPEVAADAAVVHFAVTAENGAQTPRDATLRARLIDADGSLAGQVQNQITVPPNASATAALELRLKTPRLWSPNDPHLYRAEVVIEADGALADSTSLSIGVRTVEIDAAHGLRIHGESIKLRGGCVHHANGPLGSACIPRAEERRVELLHANGFNAIRTSHNPPSRDFLDACDRLGMLVIDEAFDCWEIGKNPDDYHLYFKDWWQRDLASIVLRDRNHPSVILWSIGNEINERAEPSGVAIGKELAAYVHSLDPTRKVTAAICHAWDHPGQTWQDLQPAFSYLDVGGYNYELAEYANDHAKYPDRVMVGTESFPMQTFQNWAAVESDSWVLGDFVWTAIDYLGESGLGRTEIQNQTGPVAQLGSWPWFNAYCGDIDLIGNKKPQSYFRDVVWQRTRVEMAVQRPVPRSWSERLTKWGWSDELRSWTWPGFEGSPMNVRVYTRGDRIRLMLNGREVGSKDLTESDALTAEFIVPYAPGELKAVAMQGEKEIGNIAFVTAGRPHRLVLAADRPRLKAGRDDLSYVMVTVADEHGRPLPDAMVTVSFAISGAGEIAAVGNAYPKDMASFRQPRRDTFHGQCLAVIRPSGKPGPIELRAESPGLEAGTIRVQVVA
ncbi:MAG: sugar-binding domain-containing protein [Acidobacteriaceae bacterium]